MKRKKFIQRAITTGIAAAAAPELLRAMNVKPRVSDHDKLMHQVGFNHLPNGKDAIDTKDMKAIIHKAETRGHADHGWLDTHHTFSFANYYNPERMNFGVLRVLNDDKVAPGRGFGTHPHDNMEIISIPLEGDLEHQDSMGNVAVIKEGDVQVMSAGTGILHSEFNKNKDKEVRFLQIWIFPREKNVEPRYDQISIREVKKANEFYQVLSPNKDDQGVWIHQDAWFSLGDFEANKSDTYSLNKKGNGVYLFVLEGKVKVSDKELSKRDGIGIWEVDELIVSSLEDSRVLLMEVPLQLS